MFSKIVKSSVKLLEICKSVKNAFQNFNTRGVRLHRFSNGGKQHNAKINPVFHFS